jgi:hypothetical protein
MPAVAGSAVEEPVVEKAAEVEPAVPLPVEPVAEAKVEIVMPPPIVESEPAPPVVEAAPEPKDIPCEQIVNYLCMNLLLTLVQDRSLLSRLTRRQTKLHMWRWNTSQRLSVLLRSRLSSPSKRPRRRHRLGWRRSVQRRSDMFRRKRITSQPRRLPPPKCVWPSKRLRKLSVLSWRPNALTPPYQQYCPTARNHLKIHGGATTMT